MCGLVGYTGTGGLREESAFATLLVLDQLRGFDSTGVCIVNRDHATNVIKDTCLPPKILGSESYCTLLRRPIKALIGHNRAATHGKVTKGNAHPFIKGNIVGCHNGTLDNLDKMDDASKFGTDSEAIFHNINKHGIEDVWSKRLDGAAALVWYDLSDHTLHFIRNARRPLWFTYTDDNKGMFWASEIWMLKVALSRHNLKHGKIYCPEPHYHFMFAVETGKEVEEVNEKLDFYVPPVRTYAGQGAAGQPIGSYPLAHEYKKLKDYRKAIKEWNKNNPTRQHHATHYPAEDWWDDKSDDNLPFRPESKDNPAMNGIGSIKSSAGQGAGSTELDAPHLLATPEATAARRRGGRRSRSIRAWRAPGREISERTFKKNYKECTFCRESLADQYTDATIIDDHHAACRSCTAWAEAEGFDLAQGVKA